MTSTIAVLAEGESERAAVVGWIVLVGLILLALAFGASLYAEIEEKVMEPLARRVPAFSPPWFCLIVPGLALLAAGFVFLSFWIGFAGGAVLFFVWRISEHEV